VKGILCNSDNSSGVPTLCMKYLSGEMLEFGRWVVQAVSDWALDQVCGHVDGCKPTKVRRRQDDPVNLGMDIRRE